MDRKFVENLGWKYSGNWANRDFYCIGEFQIIDHNDDWCISRDEDWYAIDVDGEEILSEFTNLVKKYYEIYNDPENHTLAEAFKAKKSISNFYEVHGCKEKEEDFIRIFDEL